MKTSTPLETVTQFVNAMNKGDLDTVLSLYEPGASLVVQPGTVVTGTPALREALAGFAALKPTITTEAYKIVEADGVALCCERWTLHGTDPAANPVQMGGCSSSVFRRQPDGNWLIALDNPWGTEILT